MSGAFIVHRSTVMNELLDPHLIGLHKLVDIPIIDQFNDVSNPTVSAKFLISKIKKESQLTESIIKNSVYFPDIEQRYQNFSKENLPTLTYTDAVVDFNASLINFRLRGDYILFEKKKSQGYNYLGVAKDAQQKRYAESFFYNATDHYIKNQMVVKVNKIEIYDRNGKVYLEDNI